MAASTPAPGAGLSKYYRSVIRATYLNASNEIDEQDGFTFIVSMAPRSSTPSGGALDLEILLSLAIEIADALDAKQAEAAYAKLQ